jgi:DNA-binding transcriptional LysR family regulator
VEVEVCVDDHLVDIVGEGYDAGIRLVEAIDRDMIHVRLLGECRLVVAGAPSYLKRRGVPHTPEDLLQHDCIRVRWTKNAEPWAWELERGKRTWRVPVRGPVTTNDSGLMRTLGISGVGLIYTLEPLVADEIARGRLRVVLEDICRVYRDSSSIFPAARRSRPPSGPSSTSRAR